MSLATSPTIGRVERRDIPMPTRNSAEPLISEHALAPNQVVLPVGAADSAP
jgi:hypothetical protein